MLQAADALPDVGSGRYTVAVEADFKDGLLMGYRVVASIARAEELDKLETPGAF